MSVGKGVGSPTVGAPQLVGISPVLSFFEVFVYLLSVLIVYVHQPTAERALRVDKLDSERYFTRVQEP